MDQVRSKIFIITFQIRTTLLKNINNNAVINRFNDF